MPFMCPICGNPHAGYSCTYCVKEKDMKLRPLHSFLKKRRCAQCWGPMKDRKVDGSWEIYCPNECEPGGHVSEDYVEMQKKQDAMDAAKVVFNYPELDPSEPVEGESESLFQEE